MYDLVGVNANAFKIMGCVARAMRECKKQKTEIDAYYADAKSADYDHLLDVSMEMASKLNEMEGTV